MSRVIFYKLTFDGDTYVDQNIDMYAIKRVTANLPNDLVDEACRISGKNITETLIQGLTLVKRSAAATKASRLKGQLKLSIDIEASRERSRH